MPGIGNQTEQDFLAWLFKQTVFPAETTDLEYSLHSSDPGDTGVNELTGGDSPGYARASLNPDVNAGSDVNYSGLSEEGTTQIVTNVLAITWPQSSGPWNNGADIPFFGAWGYGGTVFLFGGTITPNVNVGSGQTLTCTAGNFKFSVD